MVFLLRGEFQVWRDATWLSKRPHLTSAHAIAKPASRQSQSIALRLMESSEKPSSQVAREFKVRRNQLYK
jgi:hypothetical protein